MKFFSSLATGVKRQRRDHSQAPSAPPDDLNQRQLPLVQWMGPFYRIHKSKRAAFDCPFGGDGRYDDPQAEFSCIYSGRSLDAAFVETALWETGARVVTEGWLQIRTLTIFKASRQLNFVDCIIRATPGFVLAGRSLKCGSWGSGCFEPKLRSHPDTTAIIEVTTDIPNANAPRLV